METENQQFESELYAWEAAEFSKPERSLVWYLVMGAIVVLVTAYALWTARYITAVTVVAIGVVVYMMGRVEPRHIRYTLTGQGVTTGSKLVPYSEFTGFWIVNTPHAHSLNLARKGKLATNITLPLEGAEIEKIREILVRYMPEVGDAGEDNLDKMSRFLKL